MSHVNGAAAPDETPVPNTASNAGDAIAPQEQSAVAAAVLPVGEAGEAGEVSVPEPVETQSRVEVGLVRSVRIGPILIVAAALGAVIAAVAALFFPIAEDATYTLGQVAGFIALIGAAIGLFLGGVLVLILTRVAKRQSGAALAVLTDVR